MPSLDFKGNHTFITYQKHCYQVNFSIKNINSLLHLQNANNRCSELPMINCIKEHKFYWNEFSDESILVFVKNVVKVSDLFCD